jgi:sugar (pentulose or hexulose) kinase
MGRRSEVVCGVDIGSTNVKVVAMAEDGAVVGRHDQPTPRSRHDGAVDAAQLMNLLEDMMVRLVRTRHAVRAVCTAGVGEDGVLVDETSSPLSRALPWFDPSRADLLERLRPQLSADPRLPVDTDAARTIVGWAWARQQPAAEKATAWLSLTDYAASQWSGRNFISDTLAARTAAWLPDSRSWVVPRVRATLGDVALLPPVEAAGTVLGGLRSRVLREADALAPDASVVVGGHDHPIGGWGVGRLEPGAVLDSMGTAEVVTAQSPHAPVERTSDFDVAPGIRSAGSTLLAVQELARNIEWASRDPAVAGKIKRLLAGTEQPNGYADSDVFQPGIPGGGLPCFSAAATPDALSRASAVLGRLAREGAASAAALSKYIPGHSAVYAAGGWTRSPGWLAMKSAASGSPANVLMEPEVTAVGAALLAAEAVGWSASPSRALMGRT